MSDSEKTTEIENAPIVESVESLIQNVESYSYFSNVGELMGSRPWLTGMLSLIFFILVSSVATWILVRFIKKLFNKIAPSVTDQTLGYIRTPMFWSIVGVGLLVSASIANIGTWNVDVLISLVLTILIFMWMVFFIRIAKVLITSAGGRANESSLIRPQTSPLFTNLSALLIALVGIYFVFQAWRIDMTAWLASAGILGIAIGFAAKDTLANLFSGVFIMADSPYRIGDYIVLDDGANLRGKVTHIGIRSTRILTRDDVEVTVPNSIMGNSKIINESGGPYVKYRIRVAVGVAYGTDIDEVVIVLESVAAQTEDVCKHPEPRVRFRSFGASSLDFELLCWVQDPEYRGRIIDRLNSAIYKEFLNKGIEIPYSKHDLYIKELPLQK